MLISEIITEALGDVGADTSDTSLSGLALNWVKGALRRIPLFARSRLFETTSNVTLLSGFSSVSLPSDFIWEIIIYRLSSGARIEIEKHPHFDRVVNTNTTGTPIYYQIIGRVIYFDKSADSDYTIYIKHKKEIASVTAADTWDYSEDLIEIVKDGIKYYYYTDYTEEPQRGAEKLTLFKAQLDELDARYMMQEQGGYINES